MENPAADSYKLYINGTFSQNLTPNEIHSKKYSKFNFKYSQNTLNYELNCPSTIKQAIFNLFGMKLNSKNELQEPIKLKNIFSKRVFASYDFQPYLIKKESFNNSKLNKNGTTLVEFIAEQVDETIEDISTSLIGEVEQVTGIEINRETAFKTLSFIENNLHKELLTEIANVQNKIAREKIEEFKSRNSAQTKVIV